MPRLLPVASVVVLVGLLLVPAMAASAQPETNTPADCPSVTSFGTGVAYAVPDAQTLPAELTAFGYTCAFEPVSQISPGVTILALVRDDGVTWADATAVLQSFISAPSWTTSESLIGDGAGVYTELPPAQIVESAPASGFTVGVDHATNGGATISYVAGPPDSPVLPVATTLTGDAGSELNITNAAGGVIYITVAIFTPPTGFTDPGVLSTLKTAAVPTVAQSGVIAGAAVALMLVVGWPGFLLSQVVSRRYDRIAGKRLGELRDRIESSAARRRILTVAGLVVAALIVCLLDPAFGLNLLSLRVFLTALLTLVLFTGGAALVTGAVVRRLEPAASPRIDFRWGSLVILAVAVLLSRLLGLQPGLVFGLVAGIAFGVALNRSRSGIAVLVGSGFAAVVGLGAWIGYSVTPADAVIVRELLSALAIEGVATLPIALLPFRGLDGAHLRAWKLAVWIAAFVIAVALFVLILVTLPAGFAPIAGNVVLWAVVFAVFSALAVGVWLLDRKLAKA